MSYPPLVPLPLRYMPRISQYPTEVLTELEIVMFEDAWHNVNIKGGTLTPEMYKTDLGAVPVVDEFFHYKIKMAENLKNFIYKNEKK